MSTKAIEPKLRRKRALVLLVADRAALRQRVADLVGDDGAFRLAGALVDGSQAVGAVGHLRPTVVVLDLDLRKGDVLELCKALHSADAKVPLLVVGAYEDVALAERVLRTGACGYLLRRELGRCLPEALEALLADRLYVSPGLRDRMLQRVRGRLEKHERILDPLTDREIRVFQLVGEGADPETLAETLDVSPKTVETHRINIRRKLGLTDNERLEDAASAWAAVSVRRPG